MKPLSITLTCAALFLMSFFSSAQAAAFDPDSVGIVDLIQGEVYAHSPTGEKRKLGPNSPIYDGETIETIGEGAVVLLMKDGAQWDLFNNSKIAFIKYQFVEDGEGPPNDGAIIQIYPSNSIGYKSGLLDNTVIKLPNKEGISNSSTVYPMGITEMDFITMKGITVSIVTKGTVEAKQKITGDEVDLVIFDGEWFIKDGKGEFQKKYKQPDVLDFGRQIPSQQQQRVGLKQDDFETFDNRMDQLFTRVNEQSGRQGGGVIGNEESGDSFTKPLTQGGSESLPPGLYCQSICGKKPKEPASPSTKKERDAFEAWKTCWDACMRSATPSG